MGNEVTITDSNFQEEVINSGLPVLVDLGAEWCGPCRMIGPVIEEIAAEYQGRLKVGKLDVDQNQKTAGQYGVRSIPTLLFFKGGELVEEVVGAQSKAKLIQVIEKIL
ncbi:MAG: thioredoxin [Deltaproteobacteria bacterium]|nr:thioredoxin [Deltaproteobacteria bacterium]